MLEIILMFLVISTIPKKISEIFWKKQLQFQKTSCIIESVRIRKPKGVYQKGRTEIWDRRAHRRDWRKRTGLEQGTEPHQLERTGTEVWHSGLGTGSQQDGKGRDFVGRRGGFPEGPAGRTGSRLFWISVRFVFLRTCCDTFSASPLFSWNCTTNRNKDMHNIQNSKNILWFSPKCIIIKSMQFFANLIERREFVESF